MSDDHTENDFKSAKLAGEFTKENSKESFEVSTLKDSLREPNFSSDGFGKFRNTVGDAKNSTQDLNKVDSSVSSSVSFSAGTQANFQQYDRYSKNSNSSPQPQKFLKNPKHHSQLEASEKVLQALLQNSKSELADGFLRWRIENDWQKIVGSGLGEQTLPAAFTRGTLYLWVRHSAWMQQLYYFQDPIKEKVNGYVGRDWVKRVQFTLSRRALQTEQEPTES